LGRTSFLASNLAFVPSPKTDNGLTQSSFYQGTQKKSLAKNRKFNISKKKNLIEDTEDSKDTLVTNDFILFVGSNIDPNNDKSVVTSTSFEALTKFKFDEHWHMRIGGYSYRNFTSDSGSISSNLPRIAYVNATPGSTPKVDTTNLIVQQYSLTQKTTTRSYGLYVDQYYAVVNTKTYRMSPYIRYEYTYRRIEPTLTDVNSKILDTTTLNKNLVNQNIIIRNSLFSRDNVFLSSQTINQHYLVIGMALEYSSKAIDLFFQPMWGWAFTFQEFSTRPLIAKKNNGTVGIKLQAVIKVLDVNLAADFRDLHTPRPYTNISIGIPVSYSKLKEKFK